MLLWQGILLPCHFYTFASKTTRQTPLFFRMHATSSSSFIHSPTCLLQAQLDTRQDRQNVVVEVVSENAAFCVCAYDM